MLSPAFVKQHNLQTTTVQEKRFTNVLGEPGPTVNRKCTINLQYSGVCDNKPITIRETIDAFVHPCAHVDLILNLRYAIEKGITLHSHAFSYLKNGQKIQIPFATQDHQVMAALVEAPILSYDELMDQDKLLKDIDSYTLVCITQSQVPHERHDNHACLTTVSSQIENPMDGINISIADIRAKQLLSQNLDRIKKDRVLQLPPSRGDDDVELKLIKGAKPPKIGWRMLAPDEEAYLQQEVKKLLAQGLIKPSNSKFGSHVLFVRKKDGSLRMVVDYRAINNILDDSHHNALPAIPWLLSKIQSGKRKYFSTLDCLNGYYQFRLKPSSTAVTAFQVGFTRYEWLCLPFGLRMAPSYYNRVLCNWFAEVITPGEHGQEVFVYIDDILIATDSIERHLYVLEKVFDILREKQFFLNRKKCAFFQTQVSYLGFQLSGDGITVLPEKIEAVQKLLAPTTLKEVRSLLGLFSYYRKFIPKYAHISAPLQKMVNSQLFHWDAQASIAFQQLKDAVTSAPVLRIPDWTKPFEVMVDASDYACGAVLHQCHPSPTRSGQMVKHVVEYLSHVFTKEEAKLGIAAKETFAVVYALQKFRHYLLGSPQVTVFSDNAATCRLLAQGKTSKLPLGRRQLGYLQVFGEYRPNQLILKHIPGKLNYVSDALSRCRRLPDSAPTMVSASRTADLQEDHLLAVVPFEETSLIPQFKETIIQAYQEDGWTRALLKYLHNKSDKRLLRMATKRNRKVDIKNCSLHSSGLLILHLSQSRTATILPYCAATLAIRTYLVDQIHQTVIHGGHQVTLHFLTRQFYWKHCGLECLNFIRSCTICQRAIKYLHLGHQSYSKILPRYIGPFRIRKMITQNSTLLFWQDLCQLQTSTLSKQEAQIIESFKRSRPIIHVRWLRKFVGSECSSKEVDIVQILEHRMQKNTDLFLTEYRDGSRQWLIQEQLIYAKGPRWFNSQMEKLSEVKTELLHNLQKQISQSSKSLSAGQMKTAQLRLRMKQQERKQLKNKDQIPLHDDSNRKRVRHPPKAHKKHQNVTNQTSARWKILNNMPPVPQQLTSGRVTKPRKQFDL